MSNEQNKYLLSNVPSGTLEAGAHRSTELAQISFAGASYLSSHKHSNSAILAGRFAADAGSSLESHGTCKESLDIRSVDLDSTV